MALIRTDNFDKARSTIHSSQKFSIDFSFSRYRAALRTQSPKVEMIDSLYKPLANGEDDGIMRELLKDFYTTSNGRKPKQIILFRDGVSESQFNQVLNIELDQIIKAYHHLGEVDIPKFMVIVAQKNHHTKLFQVSAPENVPPGTVVDTKIVHPRNYDFYMCAQAGMIVRAALKAKAAMIVVFTSSGAAARLIAKYKPPVPVFAIVIPCLRSNVLKWTFSGSATVRQLLGVRGVYPILASSNEITMRFKI